MDFKLDGYLEPLATNIQAMQLSKDKTGLYIAGNFKRVDGAVRARIARLQFTQKCDGVRIQFAASEWYVGQDAELAQITLIRTSSNNQGATVHLETRNGSAQAGLDYITVSQTVEFAPLLITEVGPSAAICP